MCVSLVFVVRRLLRVVVYYCWLLRVGCWLLCVVCCMFVCSLLFVVRRGCSLFGFALLLLYVV